MSTKIRHNRIYSWHGESLRKSLERDPAVLSKKTTRRIVQAQEKKEVRAPNGRTRTVYVSRKYAQSEAHVPALPDGNCGEVSSERRSDAQNGFKQGLS